MIVFHDDEPLDPTTYPDSGDGDYGQQTGNFNGSNGTPDTEPDTDEDEGLLHDGD